MATFGDTSAGGSSFPYSSDRAIVRSFTLTEDATSLTSITVFFDGSSTSAENFKGLIYADSAGAPGALLKVSTPGSLPIGGTSLTMALDGSSLSAGTYWLGSVAEGFTGRWAADAGVSGQRQEGLTYASPAGTFGTPAGSTSDSTSVYVTYEAGITPAKRQNGPFNFTPTPTAGLGAFEALDPLSWFGVDTSRWFADELATPVAGGGLTATAADTVSFSDSAVAITTRVAVSSDTVSFTDTATASVQLVATASDTVTFTDSAVSGVTQAVTAADSVSFSDSAVAVISIAAAASDTISFTDSATAVSQLVASASDAISFSDSAISATQRVSAATDSVSFSDSAVAVSTLVAEAADTVSFTDSASASKATGVKTAVAADTVSFSDSAVALTTLVAAATDALVFSDSAVAVVTKVASAVDTVAFTDSAIAARGALVHTVTAVDSVTFSDSAVATRPVVLPPSQAGGSGGGRGWDGRSRKREMEEFLDRAFSEILEIPAELARPSRAAEVLIRMAPDSTKIEALVNIIDTRARNEASRQASLLREIQTKLEQHLEDEEAAIMAILL